jgi:hypothetical protein
VLPLRIIDTGEAGQYLATQENPPNPLNLPHGKNDTWSGWDSFVGDDDSAIPDF